MAPPRVVFLGTRYWEPFGELSSVLRQHGVATSLHMAPPAGVREILAGRLVGTLFDEVVTSVRPGSPPWLRAPVLRSLPGDGTVDMLAQDDLGHALLTTAPRQLAPLRRTGGPWDPAIVYDKWRLTGLARRIGVEAPISWRGRAVTGYPVMVKAPVGFGGLGVRIAHDRVGLATALAELDGPDRPFLQEVAGEEMVNIGAVALHGELTVAACYRPVAPDGDPLGPAAAIEVVHNPAALDAAAALARSLGFTGMFNADFILDGGGNASFIDFNPRPFGSWTALQVLGSDLVGGYLQTIGIGDGPRPGTPAPGARSAASLLPPRPGLTPDGLERWHDAIQAQVAERAGLLGPRHTALSERRVSLWHTRARWRARLRRSWVPHAAATPRR